ncbi:MAG: Asp23/Gls24 family envelope stress response protein [Actinobacteria bacterium]|nr:Asp23/Gls24 family envelope stress response protein [Actinomycetota bacterium]
MLVSVAPEVSGVKVYALVGPSGTGKSHRAIMVAHQTGSDIIIDDGLIIKGDQILVGHTAKKQPTRIGAIKAALFLNPDLADIAKKSLRANDPKGVLILGTSVEMAQRIALTLGLPEITRVIDINEVASPEDIKKARINRTRFSRHVIPAPTMEVRKSFPGTLIEPLKILIKKDRDKFSQARTWMEQAVVRPTFTFYGRLTISEGAITAIVSLTASQVSGVKNPGRIHVMQTEEDGIVIEILPVLYYATYLPGVSKKIQTVVKERVEYMTGLSIKAVNVVVRDIALKIDR